MGQIFIKTNQHVKYESYVINSSQDNDQNACVHIFTSDPCDLDLKHSESKIIRGHGITKPNQ